MRIPIIATLFVAVIAILLSFWCTLFPGSAFCPAPGLTPTLEGSAPPGVAYIWLTPDKDAYVACTGPCTDATQNFGTLFNLDSARGGAGLLNEKRSYIRFYLPQLPAGTQVLDAYINLYEDSRQQPGSVSLPIAEANGGWFPREVNWGTQPNPPGAAGLGVALGPFQDVNEWRGHTPGIPGVVQRWFSIVNANQGVLINNSGQPPFLRSFSSDNHLSRTETDFGNAPRLLLKVTTELGLNLGTPDSAVALPPLDVDTDLDEYLTGPVLMVRIAPGPDWPPAWDLAVR
ncbi:MAG: DNRLRE domain-containing protein [Gammaproteobacteria bacterium]|nr:DNRLRE domain-containing protein [Gammaproteobacteria bacterium]